MFDDRGIRCGTSVAASVELQPDDTVLEMHNFHVATVGVQVGTHFGERCLDAYSCGIEVGVVTQPVGVEQGSSNRIGGNGFEEDVATPFAKHLDQSSNAVGMEDVDPIEHLDCGIGHFFVFVLGQRLGQVGDPRQNLVELEAFVTPAHSFDFTVLTLRERARR